MALRKSLGISVDHLAVLLLRDNISVFSNYKSDEYTWCLLLIVD